MVSLTVLFAETMLQPPSSAAPLLEELRRGRRFERVYSWINLNNPPGGDCQKFRLTFIKKFAMLCLPTVR